MTNRQEVAKKLREQPKELAKECFYEGARYNIEPLLFEIVYEIICGSEEGAYDDIFTKTADLIDPTCRIALDEELSQELQGEMFRCNKCNAAFPRINGEYRYCPVCGCRVVDDN